jgi:hypothetical protein
MLICMIGDRCMLTEPYSRLTAQWDHQTRTHLFPEWYVVKKQNNSNNKRDTVMSHLSSISKNCIPTPSNKYKTHSQTPTLCFSIRSFFSHQNRHDYLTIRTTSHRQQWPTWYNANTLINHNFSMLMTILHPRNVLST